MTKKEVLQILAILKAAYPSSYNGMTKEEATGTVSVWCLQFADTPVDIVMMAVQKLISTCKFPPSISEVKSKIESIHWEAYEMVSSPTMVEVMPEEYRKMYQRIYDATKDYKYAKMAEPSIAQMLMDSPQLRLGNGGE